MLIPTLQGFWKTIYENALYAKKTTQILGIILLMVCNQPEYSPNHIALILASTLEVQWGRMNLYDFDFYNCLTVSYKKHALFPFPPKYLIYLSLLVISVLEVYHVNDWLFP